MGARGDRRCSVGLVRDRLPCRVPGVLRRLCAGVAVVADAVLGGAVVLLTFAVGGVWWGVGLCAGLIVGTLIDYVVGDA